ncbi:MAG: uroporphyrinogen-III C-methyltransferase [Acidobacteria bacterium RIFCSPLOWO2_02_FULL_61_28]|nr:MAG: uroporphyrinogen-III C-methyltransferase [Acidobacteria bacterium RIFCSPLOWO2_02_FULL_61_28]
MTKNFETTLGKVYLVGAGPGDPGLLTLKGLRILRDADVVVYDYLANPELLLEAKPGAEIIYVGRHANERLSQDTINQMLVERARHGKQVCRLKGGDPFVFGRGGEEAEYVASSGVPFEIVPGVSAGYAVPAYAGIPLTHRQLSSTVLFVTGHEDPEKEGGSHLDWEGIARGASTLVFFMGVTTLPQIASQLMRAGRSASTPAAVIRWGTRGEQQVVTGTLETIAARARTAGIKPPALTVVGDVVSLREKLQWFECLPLFGERILITRPREQARELAEPLRALGAETIELPTIAIADPEDWSALDGAIERLGTPRTYDWLIFTSANGVRKFMQRMAANGTDVRRLAGAKICAIGPATADELRAHLLVVDVVPRTYVAEGVLEALAEEPLAGKRILIPRARVARDVLPAELRKRGAEVDVVEAYRSILPTERTEKTEAIFTRHRPTLIVFTSSSTVENLLRLIPPEKRDSYLEGVRIASIGPITSRAIRRAGLTVHIEAGEYTIPALVAAIVEARSKASQSKS